MIVKRYIPEEIYNALNSQKHFYIKDIFNLKPIELKVEGLYIIIDTIIRCSGEFNTNNDFIDIPREIFRKILDNDYSIYVNYLLHKEFIICDNTYSKDSRKALGYKLNPDILRDDTNLVGIVISDKLFSKRTEKAIKGNNSGLKISTGFKTAYKQFNIDATAANQKALYDYRNGIPSNKGRIMNIHSLKALQYKIKAIEDRQLSCTRCNTNGRITTNLTLLNGDYKQFMLGGFSHQIDMSASQPSLIIVLIELVKSLGVGNTITKDKGFQIGNSNTNQYKLLLNTILSYVSKMTLNYLGDKDHTYFWNELKKLRLPDNIEVKKYTEICTNGRLYEFFMQKYNIKLEERTKFKTDFLTGIYGKANPYSKTQPMFAEQFPTIYTFIHFIKETLNRKDNKAYGILAIMLQSIESYLFVELIAPKLETNKIPYQYIYDSIIVKEQHLLKSYDIMYATCNIFFNQMLGDDTLKIENILLNKKIKLKDLYVQS